MIGMPCAPGNKDVLSQLQLRRVTPAELSITNLGKRTFPYGDSSLGVEGACARSGIPVISID